jgi:hypothetical protein
MQTIEETLFANRKTRKKMLQAINQIPLIKGLSIFLGSVFRVPHGILRMSRKTV